MNDTVLGHVVFVWAAMAVGGYWTRAVFVRSPWTQVQWKMALATPLALVALIGFGVAVGALEDGPDYLQAFVALWPALFLRSLQLNRDRRAN